MPLRQTAVVDAAYALDSGDDEWLDRLLHELRGEFGVRRGAAYFYEAEQTSVAGSVDFGSIVLHGASRSFFEDSHSAMPREALDLFGVTRATSLSSSIPEIFRSDPYIRDAFPRAGIADMLALCATTTCDVDGESRRMRGCMVTIYLPTARASTRTLRSLDAVAEHVRLGLALRTGEEEPPLFLPADAVAVWRDVLAGRWRLVSSDDHGGERRLVVRPCDPRSKHALQPDERHVLELAARGMAGKAIAIELGVVESVASKLLRRGMRKLGARTRSELVALIALIGARPTG